MNEIKFRSAHYNYNGEFIGFSYWGFLNHKGEYDINCFCAPSLRTGTERKQEEQYTGLKDKNGKKYYINDIGQFENGDRFIIKIEDFLQCYIEWIGKPKCEDQGRDLYRIERAERIGNIHQDKHLLK